MPQPSDSASVYEFIDQHGGTISHSSAACLLYQILKDADFDDGFIVSIEFAMVGDHPVIDVCVGDAQYQPETRQFHDISGAVVYCLDAIMNNGQEKKRYKTEN